MDKKTIFNKTAKGEHEAANLSSDLKRILSLIDGKSKADDLAKRAPPSLRQSWNELLGELLAGGYIVDQNQPHLEAKIAKPKFNPLKMFVPKPAGKFESREAAMPPTDDLDFSNMNATESDEKKKAEAAASARADLEAAELEARKKAEAEAARADLEASVAAAKAKANAEAAAKAQAKAKLEAEIAARAKAEAEIKAKQEALLRSQAEEKAKHEAALRLQAQHEAARAKATQEVAARAKAAAEARVRADIEAAARAQQEAEAKAKQAAEAARLKIEQEALRVKSELEAAERAKANAEAARLKAEAEAARAKAELEAAKARAEAEAKALVEARIRQEAEEKARQEAEAARLKAEQEAARVKAELEAAKARAEAEAKALAEARIKQEAEEKSRREAEAARIRAEQEAARVRAEQEIVARARAEAEARAAAEVLARTKQAELAAKREAEESARRAAALAKLEAASLLPDDRSAPASVSTPAFEINLEALRGGLEPAHQSVEPAAQPETQADADAVAKARLEAEEKAEAEKISLKNIAAEMARLKEEAEEARRKAEENARRLAEEHALAEEQARTWAEAEQRAKAQAILELEQSAQQVALSQAKATKTRGDRKRSNPLPWGKIMLSVVTLVLIVAVALPYVYPLNEYIAPLEQRLSAQLKQPVHIGGLTAASIPPKLRLQNVTVGSGQEVKIGSAVLSFDLSSLFSAVKVIGNAELEDVSIEGRLLDKQAASLKLLGSDKNYPIRHLSLQSVKIVSDEVALPVFSGIADMDAQGAFSRISLHSADDKLGVDIQSDQGRWQLGVNLKESSLPLMRDIVFSDLSAKGELSESGVNFTEMDAHIYNGIMLGTAKLNWTKGWQLQGTVEAKTFDLDKMFPKLHLEGDVYGEATFSMAGTKLSQMDDDPHLEGTFNVKKGTFNVDMVETARLLSRDNLVGGRTHFDDMIGQVKLDNHTVHFRQLKIVSGMLNANGSFDVSSNNQLSGNFNAEIKMRDGSNPLVLYGTLPEEKLRAGH